MTETAKHYKFSIAEANLLTADPYSNFNNWYTVAFPQFVLLGVCDWIPARPGTPAIAATTESTAIAAVSGTTEVITFHDSMLALVTLQKSISPSYLHKLNEFKTAPQIWDKIIKSNTGIDHPRFLLQLRQIASFQRDQSATPTPEQIDDGLSATNLLLQQMTESWGRKSIELSEMVFLFYSFQTARSTTFSSQPRCHGEEKEFFPQSARRGRAI